MCEAARPPELGDIAGDLPPELLAEAVEAEAEHAMHTDAVANNADLPHLPHSPRAKGSLGCLLIAALSARRGRTASYNAPVQ